jgi:hypothetical protein
MVGFLPTQTEYDQEPNSKRLRPARTIFLFSPEAGKRVENLVNAPFDPLVPRATPEYDPKEHDYCFASAKQEGSQWCLTASRPVVVSQLGYSGSSQ